MSEIRYIWLVDRQPAQARYTCLSNISSSIEVSMELKPAFSASDWIEENFGSGYPYGYATSYSSWGGSLDDSVNLPDGAQRVEKLQLPEPCPIPLLVALVLSDGDVSFCSCVGYEGDRELLPGDVADQTLEEIYNPEKTRNLWLNSPEVPDFCRNYSFYRPFSDLKSNENILECPLAVVGG